MWLSPCTLLILPDLVVDLPNVRGQVHSKAVWFLGCFPSFIIALKMLPSAKASLVLKPVALECT